MADDTIELTVNVPKELHEAARRCASDCGFGSVEGLVLHLLREVLRPDAARMDEEELRIIEERLRDLGYL